MTFLLLWAWIWPHDTNIRTWPRYSEDVDKFLGRGFQKLQQNDRQTDIGPYMGPNTLAYQLPQQHSRVLKFLLSLKILPTDFISSPKHCNATRHIKCASLAVVVPETAWTRRVLYPAVSPSPTAAIRIIRAPATQHCTPHLHVHRGSVCSFPPGTAITERPLIRISVALVYPLAASGPEDRPCPVSTQQL